MRTLVIGIAVVAVAVAAGTARADDPLYTCRKPTGKIAATFKPETQVTDLVTWVLGFTCKNVVFAADVPKVVPKVTIVAPNLMTPDQALQLFVDALEATGLVVTVKPDTIIIGLGPKFPRGCPTAATPPPPPPPLPTPVAEVNYTDDELALLDASIKKVSDTEVLVSRAGATKLLAKEAALARGARMVPSMSGGAPNGIKLYAIRPSSAIAKLNLTNGDTLDALTVDGVRILTDTAEHALAAWTKAKTAKKSVVIDIVRRGNPLTLLVTIGY